MSNPKTDCPLCGKPWDVCTCQKNESYNSDAANDLLIALKASTDECNACFKCSRKQGKLCIKEY